MAIKKTYYNKFLLLSILVFFIISLLSIYSASMYLSRTLGNLVIKQLYWYIISLIFIYIILKIDTKLFYKYSFLIYFINLMLLIGLLYIAPSINGCKCWYVFNGFSIQPSEFMKLSLVLIEARIIKKFNDLKRISYKDELKLLLTIFIIFLLPSIFTFLEPDTGAVIVYFAITLVILFTSKLRIRYFIILLIIIIGTIFSLLITYFYYQDTFISIFGNGFFYRMDRLISFSSGSSMQLENSLIAISTEGLLGHGFNNTPLYFPESGTDFIYAVFSSNFGLIISILFICYLILFDLELLNISINKSKSYNKSVILGISAIFIFQQFQNIAMSIGLVPIIGITLPFISYGGSSLICYMIMLGIILNMSKTNKKK